MENFKNPGPPSLSRADENVEKVCQAIRETGSI